MAQWGAFTQELAESGSLLGGEALQEVATATNVRIREGSTITADGPFAETKEALGGFYLIDVAEVDGEVRPVKYREFIRATGPSVRPDLSKQNYVPETGV